MTTLDEFRKMSKTRNRDELEAQIDAALVAAAIMGRRGITITIAGWAQEDIDSVAGEFADAGWMVHVSDRRDGSDYIEVAAP